MVQKKAKKSKFVRLHHDHPWWFISWFCFYFNYSYDVNFSIVSWGIFKLFSMSMLYFPHSPHSFRNKIRESRSDSTILKFVLCENLFSNLSSPSLDRNLDFSVLFCWLLGIYILFFHSFWDRTWMNVYFQQ